MENKNLRNKKLLNVARMLRSNMTRQEKHLWYDYLKNYPINVYKQRIIGDYIADFYCHQARLVIELDGSQHYKEDVRVYDAQRTSFFEDNGIMVLRFSNRNVDESFISVCNLIDKTIKERLKSEP